MSNKPFDYDKQFAAKESWHRAQAQLPLKEKFKILLRLQADDLPLIARHRKLKWYEKPWDVKV